MQTAFIRIGIAFGFDEPPQQRTLQRMAVTTMSLLAFLMVHASMKQSRAKAREIDLLHKVVMFACAAMSSDTVKWQYLHIKFKLEMLGDGICQMCMVLMPNRFVKGMEVLLDKIPQLKTIWNKLKNTSHHKSLMGITGRNITSSIELPLMEDLLFFLIYLEQTRVDLADIFVYSLMKGCLECLAKLLEAYVVEHVVSKEAQPTILPRLYGKKGKGRISDETSKKAWMSKLKLAKFHNNHITRALTQEVLPVKLQMVFEHASVVCYFNKLRSEFQLVRRLHLSMDESNHTEATMVTAIYSPQNDLAAYAPIVVMQKATLNDLDLSEMKQLASEAKLTRIGAFMHIKAVQQVLLSLGHDLSTYKAPADVIARPLSAEELRFQDPLTQKWMIRNARTGNCQEQIPQAFNWASVPLLGVCIDQAQVGLASNQFLMEQVGLVMVLFFDKFHRVQCSDTQHALLGCWAPAD